MLEVVRENREASHLVDLYREVFEQTFGAKPIIAVTEAMDVMTWAVKELGVDQAKRLITTYFRYEDDWVKKQAYPIKLFKTKINEIIALQARIDGRKPQQQKGKGLLISTAMICAKCRKHFQGIYGSNEFSHLEPTCHDCSKGTAI